MTRQTFGITKAAAEMSDLVQESMHLAYETNTSIESPIERLLYVSFCLYARNFITDHHLNELTFLSPGYEPEFACITVDRQVCALDWPVDFVFRVGISPEGAARLAVECDGHEFHERTKEQAARDRSRDRALQAAGYTVMRFTGSEIHRDPLKCVCEIMNWAVRVVSESCRTQS